MRMIRQEITELDRKFSSLTSPSLRRGTRIFFEKKILSQNYLRLTSIDAVFYADSEYGISLDPSDRFLTTNCLKILKMPKNCIQKTNGPDMSSTSTDFRTSRIPGFVASEEDCRMVKIRTR